MGRYALQRLTSAGSVLHMSNKVINMFKLLIYFTGVSIIFAPVTICYLTRNFLTVGTDNQIYK